MNSCLQKLKRLSEQPDRHDQRFETNGWHDFGRDTDLATTEAIKAARDCIWRQLDIDRVLDDG